MSKLQRMRPHSHERLLFSLFLLSLIFWSGAVTGKDADWLSPAAIAPSKDGSRLYVACATAASVLEVDPREGKVLRTFDVPENPSGLALDEAGVLYVTCGGVKGTVAVVNISKGRVTERFAAGHTPTAPVLSPDVRKLYVCNRFQNEVICLDTATGKNLGSIKVRREPVAASLTKDGKFLLVANLLHDGAADEEQVAAVVNVIETASWKLAKDLHLPNGSGSLNDIQVSPDGKYAVVTHLLSRFHLPTTQLDRGWMNTNAKTIIDLARMEVVNTVLLDNVDRGAANPWGVAWSQDSKTLVIAHAGSHEISIIDFPAVLAKLAKLPGDASKAKEYISASRIQADVPNDLAFLVGDRRRVKLPEGEFGPRGITIIGGQVFVANYFSDTLATADLAAKNPVWRVIQLGPKPNMTAARKGEFYFHDARICFQGWQSCASCHPGDARVDALNWDLLNDGIGNPKNNKSLLLSLKTPPAMSMGVRETGEEAVRAGIRHILFTVQPEEVGGSIDAYLTSLKPVPSPFLQAGSLSREAKRGKKIFNNREVGCAACHPEGLFTDLQTYDVGSIGQFEKPGSRFDTPTLVELWRTAPYLHDGSAGSLKDVVTVKNKADKHGKTSHLSKQEINDLVAYLHSL